MDEKGLTKKLPPLELVPTTVPPTLAVYQSIELPLDTALKSLEAPAQITAGVVVSELGTNGKGFTVSETSVLLLLTQPVAAVFAAA